MNRCEVVNIGLKLTSDKTTKQLVGDIFSDILGDYTGNLGGCTWTLGVGLILLRKGHECQ